MGTNGQTTEVTVLPRTLVFTLFLLILPATAGADDCGSCSDASSDCAQQSDRPAPCGDPRPTRDAGDETFVVCHARQQYKVGNEWKALPGGGTLRVPAGKTVVEVVGTNTAVFDYQLSTEPVDAPEAKQLNAFLESFGPYAVDVLRTGRAKSFAEGAGIDVNLLMALEEALVELDREIDRVRQRRTQVLAAYAESRAQSLCQAVAAICGSRADCVSLFDGLTSSLLEKYGDVESELMAVLGKRDAMEAAALRPELTNEKNLALEREGAPSESRQDAVAALIESRQARAAFEQDLKSLVSSARKSLDDSQKVLELVRTLERASLDGLEALPTWTSPAFPITLQKGRKVTLKITPKPIASIASAGRYPKVDTVFTLQPQWDFRPAVGLSLLWADDAVFPTYGTAKTTVTEDGMNVDRFRIVEKDVEDRRFTYGLDLGITHRRLCGSKGRSCPWFDLIVNPSDDVRALGGGFSYNFHSLKLGVGALWTKHKILADGLAVDDLLAAEGELKTRDSYGSADFFVSLSVIGWEPFVND